MLGSNAKDMQYKLAAQWLAMVCDVVIGGVSTEAVVYTGPCADAVGEEFVNIFDLLADVCDSGAGWDRATQECYKDVLDYANNNRNLVQFCPCLPIMHPDGDF